MGLGFTQNNDNGVKNTFEAGVAAKCTDRLNNKVKVDMNGKVSASAKYVVDKVMTLTGSFELDLKKGAGAIDLNNYYFTPFGYQIDLNY